MDDRTQVTGISSAGGSNLRMRSVAKINANRRNGAKSKGPKTAAGKLKASQNRFLYGFNANEFIAPGEDPAAFRRMAKEAMAEWQPDTRFERRLVFRLCDQLWQRDRLSRYERFILGETDLASQLPRSCGAKNESVGVRNDPSGRDPGSVHHVVS